jgi:hypothetical protein
MFTAFTSRVAWRAGALVSFALSSLGFAQSSGTVPATCTINAAGTSLTCTTTVSLAGVNGSFTSGTLTLNGQPAGPACNGGLVATPSSGIAANTPTAISLNACPNNTNRSSLNFRWVSPATGVNGQDPWIGTATANLAASASTQYSVDVCASADQSAACTRVNATVSAAGAAFACGAVSPSSQSVAQNTNATALSVSCPGATSYQWYLGTSPTNGSALSGATQSTYTPTTASVGTANYSVRAFNSVQATADSTASASVIVSAPPQGCPAGEPRATVNWGGTSNTSSLNFRYQSITGNGVHITRVNVGSVSSSAMQYPPAYSFTQDDTTTYSERKITVSQSCSDAVGGQVVSTGFPTGVINLVTPGDARAAQQGYATVTPNSTWYIILRNENCAATSNCSFTGIYRNWGF